LQTPGGPGGRSERVKGGGQKIRGNICEKKKIRVERDALVTPKGKKGEKGNDQGRPRGGNEVRGPGGELGSQKRGRKSLWPLRTGKFTLGGSWKIKGSDCGPGGYFKREVEKKRSHKGGERLNRKKRIHGNGSEETIPTRTIITKEIQVTCGVAHGGDTSKIPLVGGSE